MKKAFLSLSSLGSLLLVVSWALAQESPPDIQPAPLVRLTGVLKIVAEPPVSAFPLLRVWMGDTPQVFHVARAEAIIPAYPVEERLREVSALGLRFIAERHVLTTLQSPEFHDRLIIIEGWLQSRAGVLRVRSVQKVEEDREGRQR
jgi:hypothetical protein